MYCPCTFLPRLHRAAPFSVCCTDRTSSPQSIPPSVATLPSMTGPAADTAVVAAEAELASAPPAPAKAPPLLERKERAVAAFEVPPPPEELHG